MLKRITRSLHLKIVILLGVCSFAFYTLNIRTHRNLFFERHFKNIMQNSYNYADMITEKVQELETDAEIADFLESRDVKLRIITSDSSYSFPPNMRQLNFEEKDYFNEKTMIGFDDGLIVRIEKGDNRYEMVLQQKDSTLDYYLFLFRTLIFTYFTIMLFFIYYILRLLLNPINKLHKNVKEFSAENLDKPLETKRKDELGELITSFNEMKQTIKNMIQSREQLLLDVSHELRTPLTRINLLLEMMDDCQEKSDILADVYEMESMVSELLESARIQSKYGTLNLEKVNIIDLIDDVSLYFENDKPALEFTAMPQKVELNVDAERIKIMLKNIISNGIKYSNMEKSIEISADTDNKYFTLKIKNYGEGIPEKELGFIFEPFYRVDKSRNKNTGGYGLGMHLVKKIVEAHNGTVEIDSQFGEWTEVVVKLPK